MKNGLTNSGERFAAHKPDSLSVERLIAEEAGLTLGRVEREWSLQAAAFRAEAAALIAELKSQNVELKAQAAALAEELRAAVRGRLDTVRNGEKGDSGGKGEQGDKGEQGNQGPQGERGEKGDTGLPGERGQDGGDGQPGAAGGQGLKGDPGDRGLPGERGADGRDGGPGPKGEPGAPGALPVASNWADGITYQAGVRAHAGGTWQALRDTAKAPGTSEDWICLARPGEAAKGIEIRGTFAADKLYWQLEVVACNGGSFVALKDDPGPCPGPGWQSLVMPGKRGDKGERGHPGPRGEPAASIAGWITDPETYTATPVLTDGERGPPIPLRGLFERFLSETGS